MPRRVTAAIEPMVPPDWTLADEADFLAASAPLATPAAAHASPYMTTAEAAVHLRKLRQDGTANRSAFRKWAIRRGLRPNAAGLYDRRVLDMVLRRTWPGGAVASHGQSVRVGPTLVHGRRSDGSSAKGSR